ncbi:DUF2069 domain-containing protein [Neisseriaceae bacterium B1]
MTSTPLAPWKLRLAQTAWCALIVLTLLWDGYFAPLNTGRWLLAIKLLPLCLPLRGILSGKIYTYQYCSMLILLYFTESVMRVWDSSVISRTFAAGELLLSVVFFVACLLYLKQFKIKKI